MHIGEVSCDLAKALYCYNMMIIQPCRIQGKIGQWLKSYLPDRKQKNEKSSYEIQICTIDYTSIHTLYSTGMSYMSQDKYTTVQYKHETVSSAQLFRKNTEL